MSQVKPFEDGKDHRDDVITAVKRGDYKWLSHNLRLTPVELDEDILTDDNWFLNMTALAAYHGDLLTVQVIMANSLPVDFDFEDYHFAAMTPLMAACEAGHLPVVEWLLRLGTNPCHGLNEDQPFFRAFRGGHTKIVQCLLNSPVSKRRHFIEVSGRGITREVSASEYARTHGKKEIASLLG